MSNDPKSDKPITLRDIDWSRMKLGERVMHAAKAILGIKEAVAVGVSGRSEDIGYRRITSKSDKELQPQRWQKQMSVAHFLWLQNPMAFRLMELYSDFVIGDGYTFQAKDPQVQEILDRHWKDPDNAWEIAQYDRHTESIVFGTFCMRAFVNKFNGHVKLSPMDPAWISEVIGHRDIAGRATQLKVQRGIDSTTETWDVICEDRDSESPSFEKLQGQVFYFGLNKLSFTLQGISDLYRIADWVDAFDQFVFSTLERIYFLHAHLYDITITDAEQEECQDKVKELELNPPKPGGFRVHSDKESWEALAPDLKSAEVKEIAGVIKGLILGSMGLPEHWFGEGGDVNKATAVAMHGPIYRKLKRKQSQWSTIMRTVLQFQIDQAVLAGRLLTTLPGGAARDMSFEVRPAEISGRDIKAFYDSMKSAVESLSLAVTEQFIKRQDAGKMIAKLASESGIEVTPPTEQEIAASKVQADADAEQQLQRTLEEPYAKLKSKLAAPRKPFGKAKKQEDGQGEPTTDPAEGAVTAQGEQEEG